MGGCSETSEGSYAATMELLRNSKTPFQKILAPPLLLSSQKCPRLVCALVHIIFTYNLQYPGGNYNNTPYNVCRHICCRCHSEIFRAVSASSLLVKLESDLGVADSEFELEGRTSRNWSCSVWESWSREFRGDLGGLSQRQLPSLSLTGQCGYMVEGIVESMVEGSVGREHG